MHAMPRGTVPPQREQQQAEFESEMNNIVQTLGNNDDLRNLSNGLVGVMESCSRLARHTADTHIAAGVRASAGLFDVAASSLDQLHRALQASDSESVNLRNLGEEKLRDRYNICNALCAKLRLESLDLQGQTVEVIRRSATDMQCRALHDIADALQSSTTAVLDVDQDELSLTGCFTRLALQSQQVQAALATTNDIRVQALKTGDASAACRRGGSSVHERKVQLQQVQQSGVKASDRDTAGRAVDQLGILLEQAAANLRTFEKTLLEAAKQCDDYNHAVQNVKMCVGECTGEYNCAAAKKQLQMFNRVVHNVVTQFNADGESLASSVSSQIQLNTQAAWQHVSEIRRIVAGGAVSGGALSLVKQAKDYEEQYTNDEEQRLILLIRGHIVPLVSALYGMATPMLSDDCASPGAREERIVLVREAARQDAESPADDSLPGVQRRGQQHAERKRSHKRQSRRGEGARRQSRDDEGSRRRQSRSGEGSRRRQSRSGEGSRRRHPRSGKASEKQSHASREHKGRVRRQRAGTADNSGDNVTQLRESHADRRTQPHAALPAPAAPGSEDEMSRADTARDTADKHASDIDYSSASKDNGDAEEDSRGSGNWSPGDDVVYHKPSPASESTHTSFEQSHAPNALQEPSGHESASHQSASHEPSGYYTSEENKSEGGDDTAHEGKDASSVHTEEHQATDASHTTDTTGVTDPHVKRFSMASK
jgi:hypothetical protein